MKAHVEVESPLRRTPSRPDSSVYCLTTSPAQQHPMFAILYEFKVKDGMEGTFLDNWKAMTQLIHQYAGSHGSRLHKRSSDNVYTAYALWPDQATYDAGADKLPAIADHIRSAMRASCDDISTMHEMTVIEDMLKA